jgi:hypothetical protein
MSANPQMLAQILMNQGQQQPSGYGGMQGQSALGGAGQLLQRIAMMRSLQQPPPPSPAGGMPGMPIQGQGAPGGIAPDQPIDPSVNIRRLLQNNPPQGSMA